MSGPMGEGPLPPEGTMVGMGVEACGEFVSWWNGEYEGSCERPRDHDGPHYDGLSWYDDRGDEAEEPSPEEPRNADEPVDDEPTSAIEQGATHFALRVRPNQRKYPGRPRGTARDAE